MSFEIGSYFEFNNALNVEDESLNWIPNLGDCVFTLSGRTAIDLVINDITKSKKVQSVYMPSYCCDSMIDPFIKNNIDIKFYNVRFSEYEGLICEVDPNIECDIFFAMSYFGLEELNIESIIHTFVNRGVVVIEDITHRLLSNKPYSNISHYCVASLRKWIPIPTGGYATKKYGDFLKKPFLDSEDLVSQQIEAMHEKARYLDGFNIEKESFLNKFTNFEKELSDKNHRYKIDSKSLKITQSININEIKVRRRKNAMLIYEGIKESQYMQLLIPNPDFSTSCPLFVPIIIKNGKRNELRKYLIENNMYFPIHWPIPQFETKITDATKDIYLNVLSIVCDQRYSVSDMKRIIRVLNDFFRGV